MAREPAQDGRFVKLGEQLEERRRAATMNAKERALKEALNETLGLEWTALELVESWCFGLYDQVESQDPEHGKLRAVLERRFCLAHAAEGLIELGLVREEDLMELALVQQDLYETRPE
jgi:hypothetical protein